MLKIIKRILGCLIVLGGIIVVDRILVYVLVDDAENEIRYAMYEFYDQENIDSLFLGSSLVMNSKISESEYPDVFNPFTS